jgi:hypothetical protein
MTEPNDEQRAFAASIVGEWKAAVLNGDVKLDDVLVVFTDRAGALVAARDAAQLDALTAERDQLQSGARWLTEVAEKRGSMLDEALAKVRDLEEAAQGDAKVAADAVDRIHELEAERDARDKHTTARIRELENAVNALDDERRRLTTSVADGGALRAALVELRDSVCLDINQCETEEYARCWRALQKADGAFASAEPAPFEPFKVPPAQRCAHGALPADGCAYCLAFNQSPPSEEPAAPTAKDEDAVGVSKPPA